MFQSFIFFIFTSVSVVIWYSNICICSSSSSSWFTNLLYIIKRFVWFLYLWDLEKHHFYCLLWISNNISHDRWNMKHFNNLFSTSLVKCTVIQFFLVESNFLRYNLSITVTFLYNFLCLILYIAFGIFFYMY